MTPSAMRVLIAGGGIAAAEAVLALDDLAGERVRVELIAPAERFVYRPDLVAEPFSLGPAARIDIGRLAGQCGREACETRWSRSILVRIRSGPRRRDARLRSSSDRDWRPSRRRGRGRAHLRRPPRTRGVPQSPRRAGGRRPSTFGVCGAVGGPLVASRLRTGSADRRPPARPRRFGSRDLARDARAAAVGAAR